MQVNWEDIKPNDTVKLRYTGYTRRVPKWLSRSNATVLRRNKAGNLVVQAHDEADGNPRTIQKSDIREEETITA